MQRKSGGSPPFFENEENSNFNESDLTDIWESIGIESTCRELGPLSLQNKALTYQISRHNCILALGPKYFALKRNNLRVKFRVNNRVLTFLIDSRAQNVFRKL